LVHPDDRIKLKAAQQRAIETDEIVDVEYRFNVRGTQQRYFKATLHAIKLPDGTLDHLSGTVQEITEIKMIHLQLEALNRDLELRVEERTAEVRQKEAIHRALFENSNDGIILWAPNGEGLEVNQKALDMTGISREEMELTGPGGQRSPFEIFYEKEKFLAVLSGGQVPLYERTYQHKDGSTGYAEINLSIIKDPQGKAILVQSVVRDITERKKAEESLRDNRDKLSVANIALEKASRLKDEFLASMSHELRTPLTGILGLSEAMQLNTYGDLNKKQIKALHSIETSGRHLLELINDILDLSKIEAGKLELQFSPFSVNDICLSSIQLLKGLAQQKDQIISFSINESYAVINTDARRLKQMLVNLIGNAIKFTPVGGALGLDVQARPDEDSIQFRVWDKGIGIDEDGLSKLFKPFVQIDSRLSRHYSGTGLGLSLVQRMADMHGGSISVESKMNEGSVFTLRLPWDGKLSVSERESVLNKPEADNLKHTVIVEDNALDFENLSRFLKEIGVEHMIHTSVAGAFEKIVSYKPGLILLDLQLQDGNGFELLSQLKSDPRTEQIRVVITSVEEKQEEARKLGASGYLVKPFSKKEFLEQINQLFDNPQIKEHIMYLKEGGVDSPKVMIVDDNEAILETFSDFLSAKGLNVYVARSGNELLECVTGIMPDIFLVDIQMPGMDGMELMRRLRALPEPAISSKPIIAVTALAMTGDREKILAAGANEYLSKPVALTFLLNKIKEMVRWH
jgi:PAS domain S-box-containing protein